MKIRLGINGFGRIGRMIFRASMTRSDIEIVAINDLMDPGLIAWLLSRDSVHGKFDAEVAAGDGAITVGGRKIAVTSEKNPSLIPWEDLNADIVAECTGLFRDRENASKHMEAGARKVVISAPAADPDITIVMGVNSNRYDPAQHHIISNASCTTNCLAPVAKTLHENFGIKNGLMTTVHAYTGDQCLLDRPHKDLRRARAAAMSMIPTTTGAARAVALVLPELAGKLNGLAIRVPTPNVSIVDFVATVEKDGVSASEVNSVLKDASEGQLEGILGYCDLPLVSADFNGSPLSSVVDAGTTYVAGNMVKVLAWYDNETGYSHRMLDLAAMVGA